MSTSRPCDREREEPVDRASLAVADVSAIWNMDLIYLLIVSTEIGRCGSLAAVKNLLLMLVVCNRPMYSFTAATGHKCSSVCA